MVIISYSKKVLKKINRSTVFSYKIFLLIGVVLLVCAPLTYLLYIESIVGQIEKIAFYFITFAVIMAFIEK